jgi:hypothetical protein
LARSPFLQRCRRRGWVRLRGSDCGRHRRPPDRRGVNSRVWYSPPGGRRGSAPGIFRAQRATPGRQVPLPSSQQAHSISVGVMPCCCCPHSLPLVSCQDSHLRRSSPKRCSAPATPGRPGCRALDFYAWIQHRSKKRRSSLVKHRPDLDRQLL